MTDHIAFDLTRLFIGPITTTPRGIDRVDLGYARHFFEQRNGDCVGVLPTLWGIRWFNRDRSMNVINFIEDFWGETHEAHTDPAYVWVRARQARNLACRSESARLRQGSRLTGSERATRR
jgi:hypothetical protein